MAATLTWDGPVGPGAFPDDPLIFERLCEAGVYLRVKTYGDDRVVAYAGQSVSLLARFDQHLCAMLSLAAPVRDASGAVVLTGDAGARIDAQLLLDQRKVLVELAVERAGMVVVVKAEDDMRQIGGAGDGCRGGFCVQASISTFLLSAIRLFADVRVIRTLTMSPIFPTFSSQTAG